MNLFYYIFQALNGINKSSHQEKNGKEENFHSSHAKKYGKSGLDLLGFEDSMCRISQNGQHMKVISWSLSIGRKEVQRGGRIWLKLQVIQSMILLMLSQGPNFKALFTAHMRNLRRKGPVCSHWCYLQNVAENSDWCVWCFSYCHTDLAMTSCLLLAQKWRDWDILQRNLQNSMPKSTFSLCKLFVSGVCYSNRNLINMVRFHWVSD